MALTPWREKIPMIHNHSRRRQRSDGLSWQWHHPESHSWTVAGAGNQTVVVGDAIFVELEYSGSGKELAICCQSRNSGVSVKWPKRPVSASCVRPLAECTTNLSGGRASLFCCRLALYETEIATGWCYYWHTVFLRAYYKSQNWLDSVDWNWILDTWILYCCLSWTESDGLILCVLNYAIKACVNS